MENLHHAVTIVTVPVIVYVTWGFQAWGHPVGSHTRRMRCPCQACTVCIVRKGDDRTQWRNVQFPQRSTELLVTLGAVDAESTLLPYHHPPLSYYPTSP